MTEDITYLSNDQVQFIISKFMEEVSDKSTINLSAMQEFVVKSNKINYKAIKRQLFLLWQTSPIYEQKIKQWIEDSIEKGDDEQVVAMNPITGSVAIAGLILFYKLADKIIDNHSKLSLADRDISRQVLKKPTEDQQASINASSHQYTLKDIEQNILKPNEHDDRTDILILTVVRTEYDAIISHLTQKKPDENEGLHYTKGKIGKFNIILRRVPEQGNVNMGIESELAIRCYKPKIAMLIGIAGQLKKVQMGDVVVADASYNYESGKETAKKIKARPKGGNFSFALRDIARHIGDNMAWLPDVKKEKWDFDVVNGVIIAGNKLLMTDATKVFKNISDHYEDALAIAMEGFGFVKTLERHPEVEGIEVRGISDIVKDGDKDEIYLEGGREKAAENASAFALKLIEYLEKETSSKPLN